MQHLQEDTIAAVATPAGAGGIGIVRVSGPESAGIAKALTGRVPDPRLLMRTRFYDATGAPLDDGIALFFQSPASYTGEDVLELHGHGGPMVMHQLLEQVTTLGARLARPGEFTERAFLNGKLDLVQAEAVADLIGSQTQAAVRASLRSLSGDLSNILTAISKEIGELRTYIEADIDFSEEPLDPLSETGTANRLAGVQRDLARVLEQVRTGALLGRGAAVVLAGVPNAGKSSLMNTLSKADRVIVSEEPGTTRDVVEVTIDCAGLAIHLTDTAGLRDSQDKIEGEGVRRAKAAMTQADLVLTVIDDLVPFAGQQAVFSGLPDDIPRLMVYNKCDLSGRKMGIVSGQAQHAVAVSAKTGEGLSALEDQIKVILGWTGDFVETFMARRRHVDALDGAKTHLAVASGHVGGAAELLAEELRLAQVTLGGITGEVTTEDLLGEIFSTFCVGK